MTLQTCAPENFCSRRWGNKRTVKRVQTVSLVAKQLVSILHILGVLWTLFKVACPRTFSICTLDIISILEDLFSASSLFCLCFDASTHPMVISLGQSFGSEVIEINTRSFGYSIHMERAKPCGIWHAV